MSKKIFFGLSAAAAVGLVLAACVPQTPTPSPVVRVEVSNAAVAGLVRAGANLWTGADFDASYTARGTIGGNEFAVEVNAAVGEGAAAEPLVEPAAVETPAPAPVVTGTVSIVGPAVLTAEVIDPCGRTCRGDRLGAIVKVSIQDGAIVLEEIRDDDGDGLVESYVEKFDEQAVSLVNTTSGWRPEKGRLWTPFILVVYLANDSDENLVVHQIEIDAREHFGR